MLKASRVNKTNVVPMLKRRKYSVLIGFLFFDIFLSLFISSNSYAWVSVTNLLYDIDGTISTHDAIGKRAFEIVGPKLTSNFLKDYATYKDASNPGYFWYTYTLDNDTAAHDGDSGRNGGPIDTYFGNFLSAYKQGQYNNSSDGKTIGATEWLGSCIHLIEDMNVPAHALNIPHAITSIYIFENGVGDHLELSAFYSPITITGGITESAPLPTNPATYYYGEARQRTKDNVETKGFTGYWVAGVAGIDEDYKGDGPRGHYGGPLETDIFPIPVYLMSDLEKSFLVEQLNQAVEEAGKFLLGVDRILTALANNYDSYGGTNNTMANAAFIEMPFNESSLKCNGDEWFKVWAQIGEKIWARIEFLNANGNLDLYLYDSSGNLLTSSASTNDYETINYGPSSTNAYYYIRIHGYNGAKNSYSMSTVTYTTNSPDLRDKKHEYKSYVVTEGESFWFSAYIYNSGLSAAGASHARLYLSTNGTFSTYGDYNIGDVDVSPLDSLAGKWVSWSFYMPNLGTGPYNVWGKVLVDSWGEVNEGNEDNLFITSSANFAAYDSVTLTGLSINGPSTVNENSTASYTATAWWSNGATATVNPVWSENSAYSSINNSGALTTLAVTGNQSVTITASYTYGGVTKTANKTVTILDLTATLTDLAIYGPPLINENSSAGYMATASWSDGTITIVSPTWSENSPYAAVNASGVLTTLAVTGNQTVTLTATYTYGGVRKTATKNVTILDEAPTVTTNNATSIGQTSATLTGTVNPNGLSTTVYFQYGVTTSYGATTASQSIGPGTSGVSIPGGGITGLTCNTTYHYRAVGSNSGGTSYGLDLTFTTNACTATCSPGDVNGDGNVNISDVQLVVNIALGIPEFTLLKYPCADVNQDGAVNILDVQSTVNIILRGP